MCLPISKIFKSDVHSYIIALVMIVADNFLFFCCFFWFFPEKIRLDISHKSLAEQIVHMKILNHIYFSLKTMLDFPYKLSAKQTIHMKCQALFSQKKKKKKVS